MSEQETQPPRSNAEPTGTDATPQAGPDGREPAPSPQESRTGDARADFPVVGIGASAGGLEALETFFEHVPAEGGLAFVVIQHLDPHYKSALVSLLQGHCALPVQQIQDGTAVEPDRVYVIPPNRDVIMQDRTLYLVEPQDVKGIRLTVDRFLRSLAQDRWEWAIGVILSGTGSDGSLGVRAIKENGGMVMAQDLESARHTGMPQSAINTGLVDLILPPGEMAESLINYAAQIRGPLQAPRTAEAQWESLLQRIFALLQKQTGHDFAAYKRSTLDRRIARRMALHQLKSLGEYLNLVQSSSEEVQALFNDMLIGVTSFFRDPEAFEVLKQEVIPELFKGRAPDQTLRIWVVGCATGEEAYSIAILLREQMAEQKKEFPVQIFATDLNEEAIDTGRRGLFPVSIASDVSPERLSRFFIQVDETYRVVDSVRKMVIFAVQNLIKDPPFSRLELISCRNLMIYMQPELQRRLATLFHYALRPGGFLFLGTSESPPESSPYFEAVNRKWKLFRRSDESVLQGIPPEVLSLPWQRQGVPLREPPALPPVKVPHILEKLLLQNYVAPCLVVNPRGEILFTYGRVGKYLEPVAGETGTWTVMHMVREGLRTPLISAIRHAASQNTTIHYRDAHVSFNGETHAVNLTVRPIHRPAGLQGLLLVVFEEQSEAEATPGEEQELHTGPERGQQVRELEQELQATKEYLQATIEELQSSNEEIQSTNEELQSANEELQTSQEEAQSVNEELSTLNAELERRVEELSWVNSDLTNLLAAVDVGIIFLDRDLHIRRFNQAATEVINLIPSDVGRPLGHIATNLDYDDLIHDARAVFETLKTRETAARSQDDRWYLMRIQPYRTAQDIIEGVLITFTDITAQKHLTASHLARDLAQDIVNTVREPLLVLDGELRVISANAAFYTKFQVTQENTEGQQVYKLGNGQWDIPELRKLLEEIIPTDAYLEDFPVAHDFETIGHREMLLNARQIRRADDQVNLLLLAIEDATGE
jgi:two-component system CheB/CheR fusion protein